MRDSSNEAGRQHQLIFSEDAKKNERSTMDVLVLTLSGASTAYLSPQYWNAASSSTSSSGHRILWTIAIGLSLLLFALNLLEFLPPSWFLYIRDDVNRPRFFLYGCTLTDAYRIVLWSMAVHCVMIVPSAMGIQLAFYIRQQWKCTRTVDKDHPSDDDDDVDEKKKRPFLRIRRTPQHWTIRLGTAFFTYTVLLFLRIMHSYVIQPVVNLCWKSSFCGKEKTLPRTHSSESMHRRPRGSCSSTAWMRVMFDPSIRRCVLWGSVGGMVTAYLLFTSICPFVINSSNERPKGGVLLQVISWLCAVGILLSTLLNGFGCVSLPYSCLAGLFLNPIPENAIANAEKQLEQLKSDWKNKMQELESPDTTISMGGSSAVSPPKRFFLWRRVRRDFSDMGDAMRRKKVATLAQMEFLETMVEEMSANVEEMRYVQSMSRMARTRMGRIKSWVGVVFSLILLSRLCVALSNVGQHYLQVGLSSSPLRDDETVDPITRILLILSDRSMVTTERLHTLSQCISLLLTAFLSASQIKVFLRVMTSIQRRWIHFFRRRWYCTRPCGDREEDSKSPGDAIMRGHRRIWFLSHPLSLLMCCYCVACIVLTKMILPPEYRTHFSQALSPDTTTEVAFPNALWTIRTDTVDLIYSGTALSSGLILAILLGILRSNVRRAIVDDAAYYPPSKETV